MLKNSSNSMTPFLFLHRSANTEDPLICFHSNNISVLLGWCSLNVGKKKTQTTHKKKKSIIWTQYCSKRKMSLNALSPGAQYGN